MMILMCKCCTISSDSITSKTPLFLQRYRSSLKTGPARDITHRRQQHIVTFCHLDTTFLPFVYWKRYLWSRLAPPNNLVNWSKRSKRLFECSLCCARLLQRTQPTADSSSSISMTATILLITTDWDTPSTAAQTMDARVCWDRQKYYRHTSHLYGH